MKKFGQYIRKLSLTQQLVLIVVLTMTFFLFFIFGTISKNMDVLVDYQIYDVIKLKQQDVIYNYTNDIEDPYLFGAPNPNMIHIISTPDGKYLSNGMETLDKRLLRQIEIQMDNNQYGDSVNYIYSDSRLYTITNIPSKNASIATIISRDYNDAFKDMMLNSVVNILMVLIALVFMTLLIWVSSIIHPLNVIRNYIEKVKRNEDATLVINREDEIGQLAEVLVEMNDVIRHQEKVKEEMIQNISHDLKTPIATIKSYGEAIKDGVYPYETLEKSVDVIIEHADRLEKKVYNLLTLNRMDYLTSEQIDQNHEFEVKEIIEQVIVSSNQLRQDVSIVVVGDNSLIYGSEEPWRVVIENLLDNALRYAQTEIVIETDDHMISVYNDGSHIAEGKIEQLFKAYEMGEGGQFGLGLSIVHKVTSNYGYHVSAINTEHGVIFKIER